MDAPDVPESRGRRRLRAATIAWLGERFGPQGGALPFARAVTLHLARPPGPALPEAAELEVARRVAELLDLPAPAGAAARLAAEPALLASFFQNADLLFEHSFAGADAVALLVMEALEILEHSD